MYRAGIIAAGEGSRLRSEGITVPKPLVPVDGVPLIERLLTTFTHAGISEIACIVNEDSLEVKRFVEEKGFPVKFVVKTTPSSMHSLFELAPFLGDGSFLLSTVDSVFSEVEFGEYLHYARAHSSLDGILAVTNFVDDEKPLYVQVDEEMRIQALGKAPDLPSVEQSATKAFRHSSTSPEKRQWVTGGLYVLHPRIFEEIGTVRSRGIERLRNFLGHLVERGYRLKAYPFSRIVDIDHIHDVAVAEEFLQQEFRQSAHQRSK